MFVIEYPNTKKNENLSWKLTYVDVLSVF